VGLPRRALQLGVDQFEGFADRANVLQFIFGDFDVERLFEGHDQFDQVEAVGAEVVAEGGLEVTFDGSTAKTSTAASVNLLSASLRSMDCPFFLSSIVLKRGTVTGHSQAHGEAAVNREDGAGDVAGLATGEEADNPCDITRLADAVHGDQGRHRVLGGAQVIVMSFRSVPGRPRSR